MNTHFTHTSMAIAAGVIFCGCQASTLDPQQEANKDNPAPMAQSAVPAQASPNAATPSVSTIQMPMQPGVEITSVGTCRVAPELRGTLTKVTGMVDRNHDGAISRNEATGAMNFLVGGLFFRADENSDGSLSMAERDAAIKDLREEHADVVQLVTALVPAEQWSQLRVSLEADAPDKITLDGTRGAVQKGVDALFKAVDKNGNDVITQQESEQGVKMGFASLGKAAFDHADTDGNQRLSTDEFQSAATKHLTDAFRAVDTNGDGSLTAGEAQSLMATVGERFGAFTDQGSSLLGDRVDVNVRR